jgi:hypothetical protein
VAPCCAQEFCSSLLPRRSRCQKRPITIRDEFSAFFVRHCCSSRAVSPSVNTHFLSSLMASERGTHLHRDMVPGTHLPPEDLPLRPVVCFPAFRIPATGITLSKACSPEYSNRPSSLDGQTDHGSRSKECEHDEDPHERWEDHNLESGSDTVRLQSFRWRGRSAHLSRSPTMLL